MMILLCDCYFKQFNNEERMVTLAYALSFNLYNNKMLRRITYTCLL